jgi:hypothetical protein
MGRHNNIPPNYRVQKNVVNYLDTCYAMVDWPEAKNCLGVSNTFHILPFLVIFLEI